MRCYGDLVRYRELFSNLFRRDFHAKYRDSALGVLWSLVNPIALMGVYLVVFGVIWSKNGGIPHYPLYLLAGITCWLFFGVSLQAASRSLVDSAELIKKVRFPRQLVAFSVVATQAVTFVVMLGLLVVLSLAFVPAARDTVWIGVALAPLFACLVLGVSLVVACLNVMYRDIEHVLAAALFPWFFLTPVLWSFDRLPASAMRHHALLDGLRWGNFVTPPLNALRDPIWLGRVPRLADVVYLVAAAGIALVLGAFVFGRVDDRIAVQL